MNGFVTPAQLRAVLLTPEEAAAMDAHGRRDAAVLVPLYPEGDGFGAVFTQRQADLRRHASEISFPGGTPDGADEGLLQTALREADEEIGLRPGDVEMVGVLPPVGTFVTSYRIVPFVGLIRPGHVWRPQQSEVARVLELPLGELARGHERKRLMRRGVPVMSPTYTVGEHFVWGATARIVEHLLERLARVPPGTPFDTV